jgi:acetyl-CoA C-acetyltransferase
MKLSPRKSWPATALNMNRERLNVNGGALRWTSHWMHGYITVTLLHEMLKRNAKRGVATLCVSGGMGMALALEVW